MNRTFLNRMFQKKPVVCTAIMDSKIVIVHGFPPAELINAPDHESRSSPPGIKSDVCPPYEPHSIGKTDMRICCRRKHKEKSDGDTVWWLGIPFSAGRVEILGFGVGSVNYRWVECNGCAKSLGHGQ